MVRARGAGFVRGEQDAGAGQIFDVAKILGKHQLLQSWDEHIHGGEYAPLTQMPKV